MIAILTVGKQPMTIYIKLYLLVYKSINFFRFFVGYSDVELREHFCSYLGGHGDHTQYLHVYPSIAI